MVNKAQGADKTFKSAADILGIDDLETESIFIPQWSTWVKVKALTGTERDKFESESLKRKGKKVEANMENVRARLIVLTAIDEKGKPLRIELIENAVSEA